MKIKSKLSLVKLPKPKRYELEFGDKDIEEAKAGGYSDALIKLLRIAADDECVFLRLDSDGTEYDTYESFDW